MKVMKEYKTDYFYGIVFQYKIDNKMRYFDIRVSHRDSILKINSVGFAKTKLFNFDYIDMLSNDYRYYKKEEKIEKFRQDVLKLVPKELLLEALQMVYNKIQIEDNWIKESGI